MFEIREKYVFIEQEKPAWLVSSMDDQNLFPGVGIIYLPHSNTGTIYNSS